MFFYIKIFHYEKEGGGTPKYRCLQKPEVLDPLAVMSRPIIGLGTGLEFSVRAVSALATEPSLQHPKDSILCNTVGGKRKNGS